jgi:hypothetical protein
MNSRQGKDPESEEQTAAHGKNFQRAQDKARKLSSVPEKLETRQALN